MPKVLEYNSKVAFRKDLNPFLTIFGIRVNPALNFQPGQYATIGLKAKAPRVAGATPDKGDKDPETIIQRAYSIASANNSDVLEFYLALVNHGELTPRLFALKEGDPIYVSSKPVGLFTLERVEPHKSLILMSTGTGLAPYISMLRSNFDWSTGRKVVIMHGVRHSDDLGYREELEALEKKQPNFVYLPVISQPTHDNAWSGPKGYIQDVMFEGVVEKRTGLAVKPENFDVYLCGNPAMIEAAIKKLTDAGFILAKGRNPGTIHIEEYW